jgi:hypothetical protein
MGFVLGPSAQSGGKSGGLDEDVDALSSPIVSIAGGVGW